MKRNLLQQTTFLILGAVISVLMIASVANAQGLRLQLYVEKTLCFDLDRDGYGGDNCEVRRVHRFRPLPNNGWVDKVNDCDDRDPSVNPGQPEICNNKDDNCDPLRRKDEGVGGRNWYVDRDRDGFGGNSKRFQCMPESYYTATNSNDCDDTRAAVNPNAPEICGDDIDNNCNKSVDENKILLYPDFDDDGFGAEGSIRVRVCPGSRWFVNNDDDCDDRYDYVNPFAEEICGNGQDDNCDGQTDENAEQFWMDYDGDGYGQSGPYPICRHIAEMHNLDETRVFDFVDLEGDCNDANENIYPGQTEVCDGVDNNCVDGIDEHLLNACGQCGEVPTEICDGIDNDCDGDVDEDLLVPRYPDNDRDGFGENGALTYVCPNTPNFIENDGDCNDNHGGINPDQNERCNEVDDNCDGQIDEDHLKITIGPDNDRDGVAGAYEDRRWCRYRQPPEGYARTSYFRCTNEDCTEYQLRLDCDDQNPRNRPGGREVCDGEDNNCDGEIEGPFEGDQYWGVDEDYDGYLDWTFYPVESCVNPILWWDDHEFTEGTYTNFVNITDIPNWDIFLYDCDDSNPSIHRDAEEICDGIDNNCNYETDEVFENLNEDCNETCAFGIEGIQACLDEQSVGCLCETVQKECRRVRLSDNRTITVTYDDEGRRETESDTAFQNRAIVFNYEGNNTCPTSSTNYTDSSLTTYVCDGDGRILSSRREKDDGQTLTATYLYDEQGFLHQVDRYRQYPGDPNIVLDEVECYTTDTGGNTIARVDCEDDSFVHTRFEFDDDCH